jgi:hypothetical protein
MISYRWPPLGRSKADRERRAAAIRETHGMVAALPRGSHVVLCGDANGVPGAGEVPGVVGPFGHGTRNRGGDQLVELAEALQLRVMGTCFQKKEARAATWQRTADKAWFQIDHVLVRSRDACWVTDVDASFLPECWSDHRMVTFTLRPRRGEGAHVRRGLRARKANAARHRVELLRTEAKAEEFASAVDANVSSAARASEPGASLDEVERELVAALRTAAKVVLGERGGMQRRLGWQSENADAIREMAQQRRALAARADLDDVDRKAARRALRAAQQCEMRRLMGEWWDRRLAELHGGRGPPGIREVERAERDAGLAQKPGGRGQLYAKDGTLLCGHDAKVERWREHFAELFANESAADLGYIAAAVPQRATQWEHDTEPTRAEYFAAVRELKANKASGEDGIVAELLRASGEVFHDQVLELVGVCWSRGEVPAAWRDSVVIPLGTCSH